MKRFRTITLGCKVNQCESAAIGHLLERSGYADDPASASPDVVVINTCTVTGKAAMQSRQAIRQAIRNYPDAKVVVTGCYAQTAPREIGAIEGVDLLVGHADKMRIDALINGTTPITADPAPYTSHSPTCAFSTLPSVAHNERTRAFLKIQDGCNTRCTYCIVPYARGRSRSMPQIDVLRHLQTLGQKGFKEVVLTGIHLGAYGNDLSPATTLNHLLEAIAEAAPVRRIRLSSIEPTEIDDCLIHLIERSNGSICRHFHIPLQSGDDTILRRMGRPYRRERFARVIDRIHRRVPAAAIGVDVMAGFPGETEEAFANTYHLIDSLPVTYLHVFPYSPREGTPAAAFEPKAHDHIVKKRCKDLRQLGERKKREFFRSAAGTIAEVLVENATEGEAKGLSDNYIPVKFGHTNAKENSLVSVRIDRVVDGTVCGTAMGPA